MRAVALAILGSCPEVDDACQDAAVTALSRLGQLRDPEAVGPWLRSLVRNNCRMFLRARRPVPVGLSVETLSVAEDPALVLEDLGVRDWVWAGLERLRPPVRTAAVLRWFTETSSYEEIAAICGVPVGTVRSRLSEARTQLADVLPAVAGQRHPDVAALTAERREEAAAILSAVPRGAAPGSVESRWTDRTRMIMPGDVVLDGLPGLFGVMHSDHADGVRYRLTDVVSGPGVTIWQHEFVNPADDPFHCPPAATWLLTEDGGRVDQVRLYRAPRVAEPIGA